jgi:hypothetical protein
MRSEKILASWPMRRKLLLLFSFIFLPALGIVTAFSNEARRLGRQIQEFAYADALKTLHTVRKAVIIREEEQ